ncbi:MAG: putative DNA-damage-inducible protein J [Inoviridae sp.]|nr:MAG: putative DNA-damage-inducible protein J [Inoviridae sp.]
MRHTRVNVTLDPDTFELVKELAELRGLTQSALLREFLGSCTEPFERSIAMMKLVKNADPETMAAVNKLLDKAKDEADETMLRAERVLR